MERIIVDSYIKGEKQLWTAAPAEEFNRKIVAVNDMYGWLYAQGILKKVSFEFKDYSDVSFFAVDVKELSPYRAAMEQSGVKNARLAVEHIFDVEYTPCLYSGAIELSWTMFSYRDFDGTVGRSWECELCRHLDAVGVTDVAEIKDEKGIKEAVKYAFEISGFEPSDLAKDGSRLVVKPLSEEHRLEVEEIDDASGDYVSQWLEDNEDYAWGLFEGETLVGYCTIGYADDCCEKIEGYRGYTHDSLLLSDVFVLPDYRGHGYGSFLINEAVKLRTENDKQLVFLTVMYDRLSHFYEPIGFSSIGDGVMVRDERSLDEKMFEKDFDKAFAHYSSIDKSMLDQYDYLFSHGEKLIESYESGVEVLDLIDVDCWVRYESLLGEDLKYVEYCAVNAVLDVDPHDIEESDTQMISVLRESLATYREEMLMAVEPRPALDAIITEASQKAAADNSEKVGRETDRDMLPF